MTGNRADELLSYSDREILDRSQSEPPKHKEPYQMTMMVKLNATLRDLNTNLKKLNKSLNKELKLLKFLKYQRQLH